MAGLRRMQSLPTWCRGDPESIARVLYVEDDDANWRVTERFLRGKFLLKRARHSDEAFLLLSNEPFDLILLDIELAGSRHDGIEICRMLKQGAVSQPTPAHQSIFGREVPIVFVTASASGYSKEYLLELGADDVVSKPVDYTRLLLVSSRLIVRQVHDLPPGSCRPHSGLR